jgi:hypothetical protein
VPLAEWSATWARLEERVVPGHRPGGDDAEHG